MRTEQEELQAPSVTPVAVRATPTQDGEDLSVAKKQDTDRPQLTRWVVLIGAATFATTMSQTGILRLPFQNLLKSELNVSREAMASFFALIGLAWYFKPLAGILTDSIPLLGTRRRHYLICKRQRNTGYFRVEIRGCARTRRSV